MTQNDEAARADGCAVHEAALDRALAEGGLRTLFQPIVDLATGQTIGWEALTRGPAGSVVERPDVLFDAARAADRLSELDWACRCQAFRTAGDHQLRPPYRLFVNAEPQVLGTACPRHLLRDWLSAHRRLRVVVEMTERYLCDAPGDLLKVAATLHEMGWEVALDDVGANDAGVALLPVLRPDIVKLDMGLLTPRPSREQRQVLRAVQAYVSDSGARVVAEGIETEAHRRRAAELNADWGQGWLLGRPAAPAAPEQALGGGKPARAEGRDGADPRVRADPFQLLPAAQSRRGEAESRLGELQVRDELGQACASALDLDRASVVLVALGRSELAPPGLRSLLARVREVCALVVLLTGDAEQPTAPSPVRTSGLDDGDPLRRDAAVALLGPQRALAFHARQSSDGEWSARRSTDSHEVSELVRAMLTRAAPVRSAPVRTAADAGA